MEKRLTRRPGRRVLRKRYMGSSRKAKLRFGIYRWSNGEYMRVSVKAEKTTAESGAEKRRLLQYDFTSEQGPLKTTRNKRILLIDAVTAKASRADAGNLAGLAFAHSQSIQGRFSPDQLTEVTQFSLSVMQRRQRTPTRQS